MNCPNCGSKKFVPLQTGGGYCPACGKTVASKRPSKQERKAKREREKQQKRAAKDRRTARLKY